MAVVAVEEPALLPAVHRIVGRVDVKHQPLRRQALPGLDEQVGQHVLELLGIVVDLPVAVRPAPGGRVFETVQRALARQRRAALAASLGLVRQQRQHGIAPQLVVVVEVLVSQRDARDPLRHQRPHRMLRETGVAVVREAAGHPVEEAQRPVDAPQQQRSGVRRDRSAVERGGHPAAPDSLKRERNRFTLCRHRSSVGNRSKLLAYLNLTSPGGRCSPAGVRNPG